MQKIKSAWTSNFYDNFAIEKFSETRDQDRLYYQQYQNKNCSILDFIKIKTFWIHQELWKDFRSEEFLSVLGLKW